MRKLGVTATNRASFYLYTVPEEIDRLAASVLRAQGAASSMSEFEDMYREVILDHYKNPRSYGLIEDADAHAKGQNPLCGDEVTISVKFAADGETIEDIGFEGRGCAISQAATSMLTEIVKGRTADRGRRAAEGGAAGGDRHPADADPAQVRDPRPGRAQGRAARVAGHAAAGRVAGPRL